MHDHGNADAASQRAVLSLVLNEHPACLASDEISREIGVGDAVARALRDLTGVGLLRQEGASVLPTRAALHFDRLAA
jgi:predicted transcriptional regulator